MSSMEYWIGREASWDNRQGHHLVEHCWLAHPWLQRAWWQVEVAIIEATQWEERSQRYSEAKEQGKLTIKKLTREIQWWNGSRWGTETGTTASPAIGDQLWVQVTAFYGWQW